MLLDMSIDKSFGLSVDDLEEVLCYFKKKSLI